MGWLSKDGRESLSRDERQALRRARKLARWPETNGRPPWLVRTEAALLKVSTRAIIILGSAAATAVLEAAQATLSGGQARHHFAVAALVNAAAGYAITVAAEDAAGLIEDAYEILDDEGRLE